MYRVCDSYSWVGWIFSQYCAYFGILTLVLFPSFVYDTVFSLSLLAFYLPVPSSYLIFLVLESVELSYRLLLSFLFLLLLSFFATSRRNSPLSVFPKLNRLALASFVFFVCFFHIQSLIHQSWYYCLLLFFSLCPSPTFVLPSSPSFDFCWE